MTTITVTPAYGRDYRSRKAAVEAWKEGKDFILENVFSPWHGKPFSIRDLVPGEAVKIRYAGLRRSTIVYPDKA